jgi:outer membrane autotransporter protein
LVVRPNADFTLADQRLNRTQRGVAGSLQQIWDSGDPRYGTGFAALSQDDSSGSYANSLDSLAGQAVGGAGISRWMASHNFINNLNSCVTFVGHSLLLTEETCGWARIIGSYADRSSSSDTVGFTQKAVTIQAAGQKEFASGWFLAGALAYENSRLDGDGNTARVDGDSALAGLVVKRQSGPVLVSAAADLGYGWYDSKRSITLGDTRLAAKANPDAQNAGLHARAAYEVPFRQFYMRPTLDLHAVYVRMGDYTESGAGPFDLDVNSSDKMFFAAAPMLEFGTRIDLQDGSSLRAFASAGAAFFADNDWRTEARFKGAQANGFESDLSMPDMVSRLVLGVEMVTTKHISAKLQYAGELADGYNTHAGIFRVGYIF